MTRLRYSIIGVVAAVLVVLAVPEAVQASVDAWKIGGFAGTLYIDPGTGSIIIQALIGALVAGVAMMGVYRTRVKMFFSSLLAGRRRKSEDGESEGDD